ncbi:AAA family ATPase [Calothrix sp. NIES-3974]|uniref:AAA family ATPase n=1 Tax=Calothrix sp. NIES-3974 TaxID=2005462 RepID=UPI000B5E6D4A|nr:ATP-binding protein [Calothrix sp. NIES-3974]BAZ06702.1 hypothetical protein NIES3974_33640 [Calothrix sp. NIES-3974]
MRLKSIRLYNFRSFYGMTPEVILSGNGQQNTIIIHGNNGSGKTNLLNAFTWVLYEKFSAAFASSEQLINKRAIHEAKAGQIVEAWVELAWEHDNINYRLKRRIRGRKLKSENPVANANNQIEIGKTELFMQYAGEDGRWSFPRQQPEDIINQILPSNLHQYFFFDGERIEQIVRSDKKAEIAEATKILLGVEVINRSIRHLGEAKKSLENELAAIGDIEIKKILTTQTKLESEKSELIVRQQQIEQEQLEHAVLKQEIYSQLQSLSVTKELQERRQTLVKQKSQQQTELFQSREKIKRLISSQGYTVLLPSLHLKFREFIAKFKQKNQINPGISREFIENLIHQQKCICGADLIPKNPAYLQIIQLLETAVSAQNETTIIQIENHIHELESRAQDFWQQIDREQIHVAELRQQISQLESEIDSINERLRQDGNQEIRDLQTQLDNIEVKIRDITLEQGRNQQQITYLNQEIETLQKQINKQKLQEDRQILTQHRIQATQDAISRLNQVKNRQEKYFRIQLEQRVQEIFQQISFAPYIPKISDKYELTLVENTSGQEIAVAASTGENQILSLSFISAIIDRVRDWSENQKMLTLPESSTFPIIMDSPFGSLDEHYRRQIAKIMPEMANQLVILATKTQWRGEVETEISHRVAREYVLVYYSSKPDCEVDSMEVNGVTYPLVQASVNQFEYTEILEIQHQHQYPLRVEEKMLADYISA